MSPQDEDKFTDKKITDEILLHYCQSLEVDPTDPNRDLQVWDFDNKRWLGGIEADNDILKLLDRLFSPEESHAKFTFERIKLFIIAHVLNKEYHAEDLPPYVIPFKNCLLPLKHFIVSNELHYSEFYPALEPMEKKPKFIWINEITDDYVPEAKCPKWDKFLGEVHNEKDLDFIQEVWGYCFYRSYPVSIFTFLHGVGANGKTVEITVIKDILGRRNVTETSIHNLNNNIFSSAELYHKLANICDDLGNFSLRSIGELRKASSGTGINAQRKHGHPFDFDNYAKIIYSCNELPEFKEDIEANWDRLKVVKFDHRFVSNPDPTKGELKARDREELIKELLEERSGIINWMIEGLVRLINNGFKFSYNLSTEEVRHYYRINSNSVLSFKEEALEYTGDDNDYIFKDEIPKLYRIYCKANSIKKIASDTELFRILRLEGFEAEQRREFNQKRAYFGYRFRKTDTVKQGIEAYQSTNNLEYTECADKTDSKPCVAVSEGSPALSGDKGASGVAVMSSDPNFLSAPDSPPMISCVFLMQEPFHNECGICHEKTLLTHFITDRTEPNNQAMPVCSKCAAFKENQEKEGSR
jgi:putative DNA primase/helicase